MSSESLKRVAAEEAAQRIESGQCLGLGTGSTAALFLEALARRIRDGELEGIAGVATSLRTEQQAAALGIPLVTLGDRVTLDLGVDGADEVDRSLNLIKGLGGALLREKIVAAACRRFIVIVDEGKLVQRLGQRSPVPVEVLPFGWQATARAVGALGGRPELRTTPDGPFVTDQGNHIFDCRFGPIAEPRRLAEQLESIPGVLGHGLFVDMTSEVIVGTSQGPRSRVRPG